MANNSIHSTSVSERRQTTGVKAAFAGIKDISPILSGILPFGIIAGTAGIAAGLSPALTQGMSLLMFAGASQIAGIDLIARDAAWPAVLLAIMIINLRFVMYSAALAPLLTGTPRGSRWLAAYLLTDQGFAVTVDRHRRQSHRVGLLAYYLGASFALWLTWQAGTAAGIMLGALVPASWELDFSIPLTFLALLIPCLSDRPSGVTASTAAVVVLLCRDLPHNLELMIGVFTGVATGMLIKGGAARKGERS